MTYNNSDIISYSGSFEFRIRSFSFKVYSNTKSRNCVLAFFAEPSYKLIENQLKNESIPRNERIQIMDSYSKMALCNTGAFVNHNSIECTFKLEGNGTLVFFPETTKYGEYSIISHYFLGTKQQEANSIGLEMFAILFSFVLIPMISIFCLMNHIELKNAEKRNASIFEGHEEVLRRINNNRDHTEPVLGLQNEYQRDGNIERLIEQFHRNAAMLREHMRDFRINRNNLFNNNKTSSTTVSL